MMEALIEELQAQGMDREDAETDAYCIICIREMIDRNGWKRNEA